MAGHIFNDGQYMMYKRYRPLESTMNGYIGNDQIKSQLMTMMM